jgi:hypothetical protein
VRELAYEGRGKQRGVKIVGEAGQRDLQVSECRAGGVEGRGRDVGPEVHTHRADKVSTRQRGMVRKSISGNLGWL